MSTFAILLLCIQACLIQNVFSQCFGAYGPSAPYGCGAGPAELAYPGCSCAGACPGNGYASAYPGSGCGSAYPGYADTCSAAAPAPYSCNCACSCGSPYLY